MITKAKERNEAKILRTKGFSIKEISKKLGVSKASVSTWVRDVTLGSAQKERLIQREVWGEAKGRQKIAESWQKYWLIHPKPIKKPKVTRFAETFFDTWTPNMSYILGYFAADGNMFINKNGSCYMAFCSTDLSLITFVKEIIQVTNRIGIDTPSNNNYKVSYTLQIGSKLIYKKLLELGFTPRKSLTLPLPEIPDEVLGHFFRGYFDGDGCATFCYYQRKNRPNPTRILSIRLRCGSENFIKSLRNSLIEVHNVSKGYLSFHGGAYDLAYGAKDVVKLFGFMYPGRDIPYLERKFKILQAGLKSLGP